MLDAFLQAMEARIADRARRDFGDAVVIAVVGEGLTTCNGSVKSHRNNNNLATILTFRVMLGLKEKSADRDMMDRNLDIQGLIVSRPLLSALKSILHSELACLECLETEKTKKV